MSKAELARQLYLISADGVETFLGSYDIFASEPKGFGLKLSNTIQQVGDYIYLSETKYSMDDMSFKMIFGNYERTAYQNYQYLIKQLKGGIVTIKYIVPYVGTYLRDVALKSITKTELTKDGVLSETFTFEPLSMWYQLETIKANSSENMPFVLLSKNIDSFNIYDTTFKNELFVKVKSQSSLFIPFFEWESDGITYTDGYDLVMNPNDTLLVGNMRNSTYAIYNDSDDILIKQSEKGVIPIKVSNGNNNVKIYSNGASLSIEWRIKVESALV